MILAIHERCTLQRALVLAKSFESSAMIALGLWRTYGAGLTEELAYLYLLLLCSEETTIWH